MRFAQFILAMSGWLWAAEPHPWAVCYSGQIPEKALSPYKLIVLDSDRHPALGPLAAQGKTLLGYVSLGEAAQARGYFSSAQAAGVLLAENSNWKGSYFVDVRASGWRELVLRELVPATLKQGFHGVFMDNLDDAVELEAREPVKFAGMRQAAVELVRAIRREFPSAILMMNRGYTLLPDVEQSIDMALGESVFATYEFSSKQYLPTPRKTYLSQVSLLKAARARQPKLEIFTLDYWNPDDRQGIARIYRAEAANGFYPYVATIGLDRIVEKPEL